MEKRIEITAFVNNSEEAKELLDQLEALKQEYDVALQVIITA